MTRYRVRTPMDGPDDQDDDNLPDDYDDAAIHLAMPDKGPDATHTIDAAKVTCPNCRLVMSWVLACIANGLTDGRALRLMTRSSPTTTH